jgi:hypothetical protein
LTEQRIEVYYRSSQAQLEERRKNIIVKSAFNKIDQQHHQSCDDGRSQVDVLTTLVDFLDVLWLYIEECTHNSQH